MASEKSITPDVAILQVANEIERAARENVPLIIPPAGSASKHDRNIVAALRAGGFLQGDVDAVKAAMVIATVTRPLLVAHQEKTETIRETGLLLARALKRQAVLAPALEFAQNHISSSARKWRALREELIGDTFDQHPLLVPAGEMVTHAAFAGEHSVSVENSWWWTAKPCLPGDYITRGWPAEPTKSIRVHVEAMESQKSLILRAAAPFPSDGLALDEAPRGLLWRPS